MRRLTSEGWRGGITWAAGILCLAAGAFGQFCLARHRPVAAPMLAESAFAAFGGLRSIATEVVWFRADRLQEEGRYVELAQLASTLTALEPHTPEVWSYASWNLAYNISIMMTSAEDRWRWVEAALRLLRDEGLRLNPGSPELCREIAWLFQLKIGGRLDSAAPHYRQRWREKVEDVARRGAWEELGMDPARMTALEGRYGEFDWADPMASAIYFADLGLATAKGEARAFLREILRQALVIYAKGK